MVKAFTIYIVVVGLGAAMWVMIPQTYYSCYGSPVPRPALDLTVPILVNHGKTVYITPKANRVIATGNTVAITILAASLVCLILWPTKSKTMQAA